MLPFKVGAVVVCDDVRQEITNKAIIIGAYNGIIITPAFPAELALCWWIQIFAEKIGKFDIEIRVIKDDSSILMRAFMSFEMRAVGWTTMVLPRTLLQIQSEGPFKLEMKFKDDTDWTVIHEVEAKEGQISGMVAAA